MRKMKRLKNRIIIGITYAEALIMITAMSAMDSENVTIPVILIMQAMTWLLLFDKANPDLELFT